MFIFWGSLNNTGLKKHFLSSTVTENESIIRRINVSSYNMLVNHWHNDIEVQRHFWATSFLLPIGSIVVLGMVVLLMVLFKRYPHMVAAIVTGILGIIMIFAAVISVNHTAVYD